MQAIRNSGFEIRDRLFALSLFRVFAVICVSALALAAARAEDRKSLEAAGASVSADVLESNLPDEPTFGATGGVHLDYQGKTLDADRARGNLQTGEVSAEGNLTFTTQFGVMTARNLQYNFRSGRGFLEAAVARGDGVIFRGKRLEAGPQGYAVFDSTATGCDLPHPHYRVGAREIVVKPGVNATARHASLWIGNTRVFTVPKLKIGLGASKSTSPSLPSAGLDPTDGIFISFAGTLISGPKTYFGFKLRPTLKQGLQGFADYEHLLRGPPRSRGLRPEVILLERDLRNLPLALPGTRESVVLPGEGGNELRGFILAQVKERAYNYRIGDLRVTRWPEVGIKWISGPLEENDIAGPVQAVTGMARLSFGRFREYPGGSLHRRTDIRVLGAARVARVGKPTTVRAVGMIRGSSYDTGETFRVYGGGIDIGHVLSSETGVSLRFITHGSSGETPFEFDNLDLRTEADLLTRRTTPGGMQQLILRYDLRRQRLFDWGFSVSRVFHCLEPSIGWRNKFSELSLGIRLVGLQERGL